MMKKIWIIATLALGATVFVSCSKVRRDTGRVYMPDMSYSRAYETYASTEALKDEKVNYTAMPVEGTIARGDLLFTNTLAFDSAGYANSPSLINPLTKDSSYKMDMTEAERLFLVNCAICHGAKLDGNGPLWKPSYGGDGPFPNAPANLISNPLYLKMSEGTMYFSVTNGRNNMGSYKSQLNPTQRWMVVTYIKSKQAAATAAAPATTTAPADSAAAAKPVGK